MRRVGPLSRFGSAGNVVFLGAAIVLTAINGQGWPVLVGMIGLEFVFIALAVFVWIRSHRQYLAEVAALGESEYVSNSDRD
jgi:ABC-type dipeptide/oligopeptide/nickel transport system permease subunit